MEPRGFFLYSKTSMYIYCVGAGAAGAFGRLVDETGRNGGGALLLAIKGGAVVTARARVVVDCDPRVAKQAVRTHHDGVCSVHSPTQLDETSAPRTAREATGSILTPRPFFFLNRCATLPRLTRRRCAKFCRASSGRRPTEGRVWGLGPLGFRA